MTLEALARLTESVHGGALVIFALLLAGARALPQSSTHDVARLWRAAGATLGVTLGAVVALHAVRWATVLHPGTGWPDAFAGTGHAPTQARLALLVAYLVTYTALEIWTNEPLRRLDRPEAPVPQGDDWDRAVARVRRHLLFNASLFLAYVAMGAVARV